MVQAENIKILSVNQTQFVLSLLYFINAKYFGTLLLAFRLANFKINKIVIRMMFLHTSKLDVEVMHLYMNSVLPKWIVT